MLNENKKSRRLLTISTILIIFISIVMLVLLVFIMRVQNRTQDEFDTIEKNILDQLNRISRTTMSLSMLLTLRINDEIDIAVFLDKIREKNLVAFTHIGNLIDNFVMETYYPFIPENDPLDIKNRLGDVKLEFLNEFEKLKTSYKILKNNVEEYRYYELLRVYKDDITGLIQILNKYMHLKISIENAYRKHLRDDIFSTLTYISSLMFAYFVFAVLFIILLVIFFKIKSNSDKIVKDSEEKYRTLFTKMLNGFAYFKTIYDDSEKPVDYQFLEINRTYEEYTNLSRENILYKYASEIAEISKNDIQMWVEAFGKIDKEGEDIRFEYYFDSLERWYSIYVYSPKQGFFATILEDITIRRYNQEKLMETNEELENTTAELIRSNNELEKKNIELEEIVGELVNVNKDRKKAYEQNKELKEVNKKLEEAYDNMEVLKNKLELSYKYKSTFLSNISHELRTPLNSIIVLSELLMNEDDKINELSDENAERMKVIYESGNDLLDMINNILDISKFENRKHKQINITNFNLCELIEKLTTRFQYLKKDKNISFDFINEFTHNNIMIKSDPTKISQILKNLIINAFKFTEDGSITIRLSESRNERLPYKVTVEDTGIGIQKDKQKIVFDSFVQVDNTNIRKYKGAGLGLAISKEFTNLLGGELYLKSIYGKGSTFLLYLPEILERSDVITLEDSIQTFDHTNVDDIISKNIKNTNVKDSKMLEDKKILCISKDPEDIFRITSIIEDLGGELYPAYDMDSAYEIINKNKLDIMICGYNSNLDKKSDRFVCNVICKEHKQRNIIVIRIGKKDDKSSHTDNYIKKPFDRNEIIKIIKESRGIKQNV